MLLSRPMALCMNGNIKCAFSNRVPLEKCKEIVYSNKAVGRAAFRRSVKFSFLGCIWSEELRMRSDRTCGESRPNQYPFGVNAKGYFCATDWS